MSSFMESQTDGFLDNLAALRSGRGDRQSRIAEANAMLSSCPRDATVIPYLIRCFEDGDPYAQRVTLVALDLLEQDAIPAVEFLTTALLNSEDEIIRVQSAMILQKLGPAAKAAIPGLSEAIRQRMDEELDLPIGVLRKIGREASSALPYVSRLALEHPSQKIRFAAVETLGEIGVGMLDASMVLHQALNDESAFIREAARHSLESIGPLQQATGR